MALSLLVLLILPAAFALLAIDGQTKRATLEHDRALGGAAADEIASTVSGVDRELRSTAAFLAAVPDNYAMVAGLLEAVQGSDRDLLQVAYFDATGKRIATVPRTRGAIIDRIPPRPLLLSVAPASPGAPYLLLSVPVAHQGGRLVAVASAEHDLQRIDRLGARIRGQVALLDGRGRPLLVASNGTPSAVAITAIRSGLHVLPVAASLSTRIEYLTQSRVAGTPWTLLIVHPASGLLSPWLPPALAVATVLFALIMVFALVSIFRRVSIDPVRRRFEEPGARPPALASSVRATEMLLRETHHRVKNDLQMLSSIFSLTDQTGLGPEDHEVLVESKNRVQAISLIHEMLSTSSDLATVNIKGYLTQLVHGIESSLVSRRLPVSIVIRVGDYRFDTDTAVVCGLMLNELVTNSLKHAFPGGQAGIISVVFNRVRGDRYRLEVHDDGVGLSGGYRLDGSGSLGLRIVRELADQLGGDLAIDGSVGTSWRVEFEAKGVALGA